MTDLANIYTNISRYLRLCFLNLGSINIAIQPKGSGGNGSTATLPSRQQKLLSSYCNNSALQWGQILIAPRVMGAGLGVRCTGS